MTATQLLACACVALALGGMWTVTAEACGWFPRRARVRASWGRRLGWRRSRWLLAAVSGLIVGLVSGWPALAVATGGAVIALPALFGSGRASELRIARVEAVEEFTRRLSDVLGIGIGLEQAIVTAARGAPAPIASEVGSLAARVAARMPTEAALRMFADEVGDPAADLVVAALILAARRRGPGIAAALGAVAASVADEVAARRRIEADRAKPRTTARTVTVVTVALVVVGAANRSYSQPYSTPLGQIVLGLVLCGFAGALWWMHSMTRGARPQRVLAGRSAS